LKEKKSLTSFEKEALALIESEYTLTLATNGDDGPWSAPVYYLFSNHSFYFFSSVSSRHVQQALDSDQAAASLYHQSAAWQDIRGIQMVGRVKEVRSMSTSAKIIARFLKRYPFVRNFFPTDVKPDLSSFSKHFKAKLYAFIPSEAYYTDNRFGFGTRRRVVM